MNTKRLLVALAVVFSLLVSGAKARTNARAAYPIEGATHVSLQTTIGISYPRPVDRSMLSVDSFVVTGSIAGRYAGSLRLSADNQTVIFTPATAFAAGEIMRVRVGRLALATAGSAEPYAGSFFTEPRPAAIGEAFHSDDPVTEMSVHPSAGVTPLSAKGGLSPQSFPLLTVVNDDDPSDGNLYVANFKFAQKQGGTFRMILDKQGSIVYAQEADSHVILDFKPHPNGRYTYFDSPTSSMIVLDSTMNVIDTLRAANGYAMDGHEMHYNADGSYYVIVLHPFKMNMRPIFPGADTNATVIDNIVQEFDKDKNLIFEWRGLDHYQLTDIQNESLSGQTVDYCHMNAIEIDTDGNLLLSCRHMDEITKVNRQTGDIIWRWGGKNNQFTFLFDTIGFSHQHAIRYVPTGTYTLFDNGNYHKTAATFSRALEYKLDQVNKTASLVWEYRHQPLLYGSAMGYVQRLPNGNTLIGWGACENVAVTEVGPFKRTVFELSMDSGNYSYRAYKYPPEYLHESVARSASVVASGTLTCSPNPVTTNTTLHFSLEQGGPTDVSVYNALGVKVSSVFEGTLAEGSYTATVDSRGLAAGVYYVRIGRPGGSALECKLLVVR